MNRPSLVVVHPLVLLSVADHHNRVVGKYHSSKRVVGALLGIDKLRKIKYKKKKNKINLL